MHELPIYSNELNEYEYETDIVYGWVENKKYNFFIFFNSITDDKYPYMRVTNGSDYLNYTKSCRISLLEPKYIEVNDDPLDTWRFTDSEKSDFIKMMNSSAKEILNHDHVKPNITFWEYLLKEYDFQVDNKGDKCLVGRPMPNYNLL